MSKLRNNRNVRHKAEALLEVGHLESAQSNYDQTQEYCDQVNPQLIKQPVQDREGPRLTQANASQEL